jgi:hypothetical protein
MWMEENIGERINVNRTREAVGTGADQIAVGCPFCRVMLSDGLATEQASGGAREEVEVLDVAQMLLASVKGESATRAPRADDANPAAAVAAEPAGRSEETRAEPEPGDDTQTDETVTETADVGPAAAASSSAGGSSLFDVGPDEEPQPAEAATDTVTGSTGGSLFDLGEAESAAELPSAAAGRPDEATQASDGDSLFDIAGTSPESESSTTSPEGPDGGTEEGGSLFDL